MYHIVSHTHWDREWFVPSGFTRAWLPAFFTALEQRCTDRANYRFMLDGQTILLEDLAAELRARGEDADAVLERVAERVRSGKISVGPFYQQPDWQLVSGEALIRNLLLGAYDTAAVTGQDESKQVAWLLDNFGQIAQAPQICAQFGLEGVFAWRGFDLLPRSMRSTVWWQGPDGSRIPVVYLVDGYRNAMRLFQVLEPGSAEFAPPTAFVQNAWAPARLRAIARQQEKVGGDSHVLLLNGYDQEMEPEDVARGAELLGIDPQHVCHTTPRDFLHAKAGSFQADAPTVFGAQYSGRFVCVFPGVLSARPYLKIANAKAQAVLERYLEPLATLLAPERRAELDCAVRLERIWRLVLQNHPHDSICGVSLDPVHEEMELRFARIEREQATLLQDIMRALGSGATSVASAAADGAGGTLDVFNPATSVARAALVVDGCIRLTEPIAPLSFGRVTLTPTDDHNAQSAEDSPASVHVERTVDGDYRMQNEKVRCKVDTGGNVALDLLPDGPSFRGLHRVEVEPDHGDTYSFAPSANSSRVVAQAVALRAPRSAGDEVAVEVVYEARLPANPDAGPVRLRVVFGLRRDESFVRVRASMINRHTDFRLRIGFRVETGDRHARAHQSARFASYTQFAVVEFPNHDETNVDAQVPSSTKALMLGAREPDSRHADYPSDRAVALAGVYGGVHAGIVVAHRGIHAARREGETLYLTLLRAVRWLAREDVSTRTGDAGPRMLTIGALCLRRLEWEYALMPSVSEASDPQGTHAALFTPAILAQIDSFLHPPLVLPPCADRFPARRGVLPFEIDLIDRQVSISAIKPAGVRRDDGSVVVRCTNPIAKAATLRIRAFDRAVYATDAAEKRGERLAAPGEHATIAIGPYAIVSLLVAEAETVGAVPSDGSDTASASEPAAASSRWTDVPYLRFDERPYALPAHAWRWVFGPVDQLNQRIPAFPDDPRSVMLLDEVPVGGPTAADLRAEWDRVATIGKEISALRTAAAESEDTPPPDAPARVLAQARLSTAERAYAEAQLSALWAQFDWQRRTGQATAAHTATLYEQFTHWALVLNRARITKRTDDYVVAVANESGPNL